MINYKIKNTMPHSTLKYGVCKGARVLDAQDYSTLKRGVFVKNLDINKRAQEEMTGFALIIIIVAILGLVALTFMLRKPSESQYNSFEIQQFLDSVSRVQGTCTPQLDFAPLKISGMVQECFSNNATQCKSQETVCQALEKSLKEIITGSWNIQPNSPYTGFKLDLVFEGSSNLSSSFRRIMNISYGSCGNTFYGGDSILPEESRAGNFITRLQLCLSNSTN